MRWSVATSLRVTSSLKRKRSSCASGSGIGAFQFDGVLRRKDEERLGQIMGFPEHGDAAFLHRFEQGGLGFRRGAVDFVGQHDVGEKRSGLENELAAAVDFLEDRIPGDVAGQQVGRELDALGAELQQLGKPFHQLGFPQSGQAFEQNVASGEDAGDHQIDEFLLAEEDLVQPAGQRAQVFGGIGDFRFGGVFHGFRREANEFTALGNDEGVKFR